MGEKLLIVFVMLIGCASLYYGSWVSCHLKQLSPYPVYYAIGIEAAILFYALWRVYNWTKED